MSYATSLLIALSFGSVSSLCCTTSVLTAWCLMPHWRSLQNYISVNQVLFGTLHLCWCAVGFRFSVDGAHKELFYKTSIALFILTICWSFNATILAYMRLVMVFNQKISHEKRKVTVSTFSMAGAIIVSLEINCYIYGPEGSFVNSAMCICLVMAISVVLFCKIVVSVMSCCKKRLSRRRLSHVTSLLGVAIVCDVFTITYYFSTTFLNNLDVFYCVLLDSLFVFRLIPQTIIILLNRASREHIKRYRQRRNRLLSVERMSL